MNLEPETPVEDIRKKYKKLSILVHPDKNPDDKERAQNAFEIVNKAWKILEHDGTRKRCMRNYHCIFFFHLLNAILGLEMYEEAKQKTEMMISEKRKKLKREGRGYEKIPEDDPVKKKHTVYVTVMKIFADAERRRQNLETKDMEERYISIIIYSCATVGDNF